MVMNNPRITLCTGVWHNLLPHILGDLIFLHVAGAYICHVILVYTLGPVAMYLLILYTYVATKKNSKYPHSNFNLLVNVSFCALELFAVL